LHSVLELDDRSHDSHGSTYLSGAPSTVAGWSDNLHAAVHDQPLGLCS
jgi:hypothetical protein